MTESTLGRWSSSTACGCTRRAGIPGSSTSSEAGYQPTHRAGRTSRPTVAEAREHPELVANTSIDDAVAHYARVIESLESAPVIIGHSFGGLITEKLLGQGMGAAGVAIDPAQIKGVLPLPLAQLRAGLPALGNPANLRRSVSLTREEFRYGFGNAVTRGGVRRALRALDDPLPGAAPVPGGGRQFRSALASEGRHGQRTARSPAADLGHRGPHRPGRGDPIDPQAVSRLGGGHRAAPVRGTRTLTDRGQRLEGRRRRRPGLAEAAGPLMGRMTSWS